MLSYFKTITSYFKLSKDEDQTENDKYLREILAQDVSEIDICENMTGIVTHLFDTFGLVDGEIYFNLEVAPDNISLRDLISFVAVRSSEKEQWRVKSIQCVQNEFWDVGMNKNNQLENKVEPILKTSPKNPETSEMSVHVGKIEKRSGREIVISGGIKCNLDEISSEFLPIKGDFIQLDVVSSNNSVTKYHNLRPLRFKTYFGRISNWEADHKIGMISSEVYFSKEVCEPGFIPIIGDEVIADVIESEQGSLVWRAIQVLPLLSESKALSNTFNEDKQELPLKSNDVCICQVPDVLFIILGKQETVQVDIENEGCEPQVLHSYGLKNPSSQFTLLRPDINDLPISINPKETVSFTFNAKARFIGTSDDTVIWKFDGFSIGCKLVIQVEDSKTRFVQNSNKKTFEKYNRRTIDAKQLIATMNGFCTPGVRPIKPPSFVPVSLGMFKVPKNLISDLINDSNKQRSEAELKSYLFENYPYLEGPITPEVYRDRWHMLLYLEETQNIIDTNTYDLTNATFRRVQGDYLSLEVQGLAERRPSLIVGDKVIVKTHCNSHNVKILQPGRDHNSDMYEGYIHKVLNNEVFIKFAPNFHSSYSGTSHSVSFQCGRMSFRRLHQAINLAVSHLRWDWIFPSSITYQPPLIIIEDEKSDTDLGVNNDKQEKSYIKPSKEYKIRWNSTSKLKSGKEEIWNTHFPLYKKKKINWFNKNLNELQKQAVKHILIGKARPLPYVIFGPPGTGKTITLVEAALQLLILFPDSRLLIATPSNSAADLIAEKLMDSGLFSPGMLIRLVSHNYATDSRLSPYLVPVCGVVEMKSREESEDVISKHGTVIKNLPREKIGLHRVTIGTCSALGVLYNLGFPKGHFTHILVDEAGQATEPESLIPIVLLHMERGQVILAGDPLQLGPVVTSSVAADLGLSESLLARLLRRLLYSRDMLGFPESGGYNPHLITRLVNNYRSLPEILNLPSMMFYDGDLVPLISEENSEEASALVLLNKYLDLPPREGTTLPPAVIFHGVRGSNAQTTESPSWYNPQEAVQVGQYVERAYDSGLSEDQIGVITPYQKQVTKLRETIAALDVPVPKVGSVEEFQGQERILMILSTVRSNTRYIQSDVTHSLGFVASPRRLNVALTRARALLIIIGDPHLLIFDNYWRSVLMYCVDHNAYIGCDLPENVT